MIRSFADQETEDIFNGRETRAARKRLPPELWKIARRKLVMVNQVKHYAELRIPPSNRLHPLVDDRKGQWAIRINDKYRVAFRWDGEDAVDVEVTDYH